MAVSDYNNLRHELRMNVRDEYGIQWSDTALDIIINDAQREYSFYAQNLVGECEIKSSDLSVIQLPEDFISPIKIIDTKGREIPIVSWRELVKEYDDFRKVKGEKVQYCCFDFNGSRYMRIFPIIPADLLIGTLLYTRFSAQDKLEVKNTDALKEHCLFQMAFVTSNNKYSEHYNNFIRLIDTENRSNHTLNVRKKHRCPVWY